MLEGDRPLPFPPANPSLQSACSSSAGCRQRPQGMHGWLSISRFPGTGTASPPGVPHMVFRRRGARRPVPPPPTPGPPPRFDMQEDLRFLKAALALSEGKSNSSDDDRRNPTGWGSRGRQTR